MKLKKILDTDNIQGFKIMNPSKKFKKMFPKKYIISIDLVGKHHLLNSNSIPSSASYFTSIGYIFTYNDKLPNYLYDSDVKYENIGSTFVRCLDTYFVGENDNDSENVDLILACGCKNGIVPPTFTEELIIRCNSESLTKTDGTKEAKHNDAKIKNIRTNVMKIIHNYMKTKKYTTEEWVKDVIFNYPVNSNGLPVHYPKLITNENINSFTLHEKDVFIEYDFRAKSYEQENEFISELEDAFESPNEEVYITNSYNNILETIKKKLDEKKYKWSKVDDNTIKTKFKFLRDIDIEYQLTDFI